MIYLDHNASSPLRPEVARLLAERLALPDGHGNASSVHAAGRAARARLEAARAGVARVLGCEPREVTFTGSGSEADALALVGTFLARRDADRRRVVASGIEHAAVQGALAQLERLGAEVVRVPPGPDGRVPAEALLAALTPDTLLCTLMWANNETGVLQPVREVARACRERRVLFHTDAVQAAGKVEVTLRACDADLLALSAHKFGGPPGVGVLVVRRGVDARALVPGHQEGGRRGGTPNVALVEAAALALELAHASLEAEAARVGALRDRLEREVLARVPRVRVNGRGAPRVPNTSNLHFEGADGEALLIALDLEGICASAGAACASGSLSPSHVLTAMGLPDAEARASLRFSLGPATRAEDVERTAGVLARLVPSVR